MSAPLYGLVGRVLGHSFSPEIHRLLWNCDYRLLPMEEAEARLFFEKREFAGVNVTIPYKQLALEACDIVSLQAQRIGAVNTVINRDGQLYGYNTDYEGMRLCLAAAGISLDRKKVVIFGSGGTSHTARTLAADLGAACIVVVSRNGENNYENLTLHHDADVLINTTPLGMYPNADAAPVFPKDFRALSGVMDAVYNPLNTRLVQEAQALGIPATCGLPMLVWQGAAAAGYFCGRPIENSAAAACLETLQRSQQTLVLIGMPGCGKSTVGRLLAEKLQRPFVDLDAEIEAAEGKSIPDIFSLQGEEGFRDAETRQLRRFAVQHGLVLACGGGTVLREENRFYLRQNGRIYYLVRTLEQLATSGRPLSGSMEALQQLYAHRQPIYEALADVTVPVFDDPEVPALAIEEDFIK